MPKRKPADPSVNTPTPPKRRGRPSKKLVVENPSPVDAAEPITSTTTAPKPKIRLQTKAKDEMIKIQEEQITELEKTVTDCRAENDGLKKDAMQTLHETCQLKEDKASLQREKAALQRAVRELAATEGRAEHAPPSVLVPQGYSGSSLTVGIEADQGSSMADTLLTAILGNQPQGYSPEVEGSRERMAVNPSFVWGDSQGIADVLKAIFAHVPSTPAMPEDDVLDTIAPHHQQQVAVMNGLGHAFAGLHRDLPTFAPGPFLQCPVHQDAPIFGMLQLNHRFLYGGCADCYEAGWDCPINSSEFHYLRLAYGCKKTIAWIPDNWVAKVLCHASIP